MQVSETVAVWDYGICRLRDVRRVIRIQFVKKCICMSLLVLGCLRTFVPEVTSDKD